MWTVLPRFALFHSLTTSPIEPVRIDCSRLQTAEQRRHEPSKSPILSRQGMLTVPDGKPNAKPCPESCHELNRRCRLLERDRDGGSNGEIRERFSDKIQTLLPGFCVD